MNEQDVLDWAEEKGIEDGDAGAPYSPPLIPGLFPDADDAYNSAYWHSFAYAAPWPGPAEKPRYARDVDCL